MSNKIHSLTKNNCLICCCETKQGLILHKTKRQTHKLCIDCVIGFFSPYLDKITSNIMNNINNLPKIMCPGNVNGLMRNQCNHKLNLFKLLNVSIFIENSLKYEDWSLQNNNKLEKLYIDFFRIEYIIRNPNSYICRNPSCKDIIHPISNYGIILSCQSCDMSWCKYCWKSPYHFGKTCIEAELEENNSDNAKLINKKIELGEIKLCPVCKTPTEKIKNDQGEYVGCNKIDCNMCGTKWCWLCKEINIDYHHYNELFGGKCANKLWEGVTL